MDETALAVLVFDGQKEDLFETLGQWDRDLTRASRKAFSKLLVAGRVDAGGLRVSRSQVETFAKERGFLRLLETSAKTGIGCEELKQAILDGIRWEDIPVALLAAALQAAQGGDRPAQGRGPGADALQRTARASATALGRGCRGSRDEELKAVVGLFWPVPAWCGSWSSAVGCCSSRSGSTPTPRP